MSKSMNEFKIVSFETHSDERGSLIALEESRNIPFKIKRIYYIFGTNKNMPRGFHAHKKLKQIAICLSGSCKIKLDNGKINKTITLNNPSTGILIDKMIWREMHSFSPDCILLVLASENYDDSDYIKNYNDFLKEIKKIRI